MSSRSSKVYLQQIADRVGVSASGVSLALRNHSRISAATRLKVQRAAEELGYAPRRSLAQTRRFGFVYVDPSPIDFAHFNFAPAFQLLMRESLGMSARVEMVQLDDDLSVANTRQRLQEFAAHLDGLLLLGRVHAPIIEILNAMERPSVVIGETDISEEKSQQLKLQRVTDDPMRAGFIAAQYLLRQRGRRRIAFLAGTRIPGFFYDRWYDGFFLAHGRARVPVAERFVLWQEVGNPLRERIAELTSDPRQRPDAIVWPDASIALSLRPRLQQQGLQLDPADEVIAAASHSTALVGQEHYPQVLGDMAAMTEEAVRRLQAVCRHGANRAVTITIPNVIRNMEA